MTKQEISDEVKQAIKDEFDEVTGGLTADEFIECIEAKLSSKYPKKGVPCEVWNDGNPERLIQWATGNGFFTPVVLDVASISRRWDHYREILTAKAVIVALDEHFEKSEASGNKDFDNGVAAVYSVIHRFIDNAKEG